MFIATIYLCMSVFIASCILCVYIIVIMLYCLLIINYRKKQIECRRFDRKDLRQVHSYIATDEDLCGQNVYISICFSLLRDCSTICPILIASEYIEILVRDHYGHKLFAIFLLLMNAGSRATFHIVSRC